ncbi:MAG: acyl-CoA thioesterase II [Chromatiales bacterium]|jgi:acyl-CoA thioesterase II|nr:acyl-CoA thioesterase II [Chromatiales bacterium]
MFTQLMTLSRQSDSCFRGEQAPDKGERLFGGQLLAQALCAAQATIEASRDVHSLHAYFLRPGDVDLAVDLEVEEVRNGRKFSSREIRATQADKERFRMMVSLHLPDESPIYSRETMPDVPEPESVPFTYDDFAAREMGLTEWHGANRPIDIRYINPPGERGVANTDDQLMWMRIDERLSDDPRLHRAGLAYMSDATLIDHVMLPHGLRWQDAGFDGASLDHSMWFHHPARADEWLLSVQRPQATGRGRGISEGLFFDRMGNLVATCKQEGLMRWS